MRTPAILIALTALAAVILPTPGVAFAETRYVGGAGGTGTIQAAINASATGDVIIVRDGIWKGDGNRDIDFHGKALVLLSENGPDTCTIDCGGAPGEFHSGFFFHTGEGTGSVVGRFTITNALGGAIVCDGGSPLIIGNRIAGNCGVAGGGVACRNSSAVVFGNEIVANNAYVRGGGISCTASAAIVAGNLIAFNSAPASGGLDSLAGGAGLGSPFVVNNVICANTAGKGMGGGMGVAASSPTVMCNLIIANTAGVGGGICAGRSGAIIANNVIAANEAAYGAGACLFGVPSPIFTRNTFTGNNASKLGGALGCAGTRAAVSNCIFWSDLAFKGRELAVLASPGGSSLAISFCNVMAGQRGAYVDKGCTLDWGKGMLDTDPMFADAKGDLHLQSKYGRPDVAAKADWAADAQSSPCIDAGDPVAVFSHEPLPNGGRIDIGAYADTADASRSAPKHPPASPDINGDGKVDKADLEAIRTSINKNADEGDNWKYDVNGDGKVNILDMLMIRNKMMKEKAEQQKTQGGEKK